MADGRFTAYYDQAVGHGVSSDAILSYRPGRRVESRGRAERTRPRFMPGITASGGIPCFSIPSGQGMVEFNTEGEARCSFDKRLQYHTQPDRPDPVYAKKLQEILGGQFGEITVMMQYLFQG